MLGIWQLYRVLVSRVRVSYYIIPVEGAGALRLTCS